MTVRVLLDVDGVLNAVDRDPDTFADMVCDTAMGFAIHYSPTVGKFFTELAEMADVLWLTTWENMANEFISPMLDMPQFPLAGDRDYTLDEHGEKWWKLVIAQELWGRDQSPFVWLDDDLAHDSQAQRWLATLPEGSFLAIAPKTRVGLTQDHLDMIDDFVDGNG